MPLEDLPSVFHRVVGSDRGFPVSLLSRLLPFYPALPLLTLVCLPLPFGVNDLVHYHSTSVSGKFVMTGGSIQSNTASSQGAGVYVSGIFTMIGGSISSNWAAGNFGAEIQGGGVYIDNGGVVKITGSARITGNQTGVDASTSGMNGGGVYVSENATFKVSGAPTIYWNDNKNSNGTQNDVNIDINSFTRVLITIDGELTGGTIGVSGEGIFTRGCNGNAETYKKFFAAHHANYAVVVDDASGELAVELDP